MMKFALNRTQFCLMLFFILVGAVGCQQANTAQQNGENTIASSIIEDLRLSDTTELNGYKCANLVKKYAPPVKFKAGDRIQADTIIFIDFDEVYMSWQDFDLQVICESANIGVYRTYESFIAPNDGSMWFIGNDE